MRDDSLGGIVAQPSSSLKDWLLNHPFKPQEIIGGLYNVVFWTVLAGAGLWLFLRRGRKVK